MRAIYIAVQLPMMSQEADKCPRGEERTTNKIRENYAMKKVEKLIK